MAETGWASWGKRRGARGGYIGARTEGDHRHYGRNYEGGAISGEARISARGRRKDDVGMTSSVGGDADMRVLHVSGEKKKEKRRAGLRE